MPDSYSTIRDTLQRAYDADVARRDALTPPRWRTELIDGLAAELRRRDLRRVIELGAGTGQLARHLTDSGFDVLATDLSAGSVAAIRRRGLAADVVDFADLPYDDATFDAAFAMNSLLHVPKDHLPAVIGGVRRILRAGGLLLMVVWGGYELDGPLDGDWLDPPRFFSLYADPTFHALEFAGFTTVRSEVLDVDSGGGLHPQVKLLEAA